jgi:hypothetical protein
MFPSLTLGTIHQVAGGVIEKACWVARHGGKSSAETAGDPPELRPAEPDAGI